jgi:hypothetical protein
MLMHCFGQPGSSANSADTLGSCVAVGGLGCDTFIWQPGNAIGDYVVSAPSRMQAVGVLSHAAAAAGHLSQAAAAASGADTAARAESPAVSR